jgi:hypothetical protein
MLINKERCQTAHTDLSFKEMNGEKRKKTKIWYFARISIVGWTSGELPWEYDVRILSENKEERSSIKKLQGLKVQRAL